MWRLVTLMLFGCCASCAMADWSSHHSSFWRIGQVQLAGIPAGTSWQGSSVSFRGSRFETCQAQYHLAPQGASLQPVLYLTSSDGHEEHRTDDSRSWMVLEVRGGAEAGLKGLDPVRHPAYASVLSGQRALELLLALTARQQAGLVGEGWGGTVALALAALVPERVAFVCARQPQSPPALDCFAATNFASAVHAPTLIGVDYRHPRAAPDMALEVYSQLIGCKQLAELSSGRPARRHTTWQNLWRTWAGSLTTRPG